MNKEDMQAENIALQSKLDTALEALEEIKHTCISMAQAGRETGSDAHYIYEMTNEFLAKCKEEE